MQNSKQRTKSSLEAKAERGRKRFTNQTLYFLRQENFGTRYKHKRASARVRRDVPCKAKV